MSKSATTPSVGRILHYLPASQDFTLNYEDPSQPLTCQILYVRGEKSVDLNVIDQHGQHHFRKAVPILEHAGEHTGEKDACVWMPYQKAVAAGDEKPAQHA